MRRAPDRLYELIQPIVEGLGYEMLGIEYLNPGSNGLLRIYIDSDKGILVEDCEKVSRQVSAMLDVEDPLQGQYTLEVSSPGLDRPLFEYDHFVRFVGQRVKLSMKFPVDGRWRFEGLIDGCSEGKVTLDLEGEKVVLTFDDIAKARLVPEF